MIITDSISYALFLLANFPVWILIILLIFVHFILQSFFKII